MPCGTSRPRRRSVCEPRESPRTAEERRQVELEIALLLQDLLALGRRLARLREPGDDALEHVLAKGLPLLQLAGPERLVQRRELADLGDRVERDRGVLDE